MALCLLQSQFIFFIFLSLVTLESSNEIEWDHLQQGPQMEFFSHLHLQQQIQFSQFRPRSPITSLSTTTLLYNLTKRITVKKSKFRQSKKIEHLNFVGPIVLEHLLKTPKRL